MARSATKALAVWVVRRLRSAGHEALLAGGCVRDMLLGTRPADYDVATSATPRQVQRLFPRVRMVGAQFGVAMVIRGGRPIEVATFRTDLSYSDGRRPDAVRFTSARDDARRRDFTINGMFYDPIAGRVVDYVGGRKDLASGLVRAIGEPAQRFAEDHLRMLRAVRFATRLGFRIERATGEAIRRGAVDIARVSGERVREELEKILTGPDAATGARRLRELGLARPVLPELFAAGPGAWDVAVARLAAVAARRDATLSFAALLGGLDRPTIARIVRRWGGANELRDALQWIASRLDDWPTAAELPLCEFKRLMAHQHFHRLRALWRFQERRATGSRTHSRRIARRAGAVPPQRVAPRPLVTGGDLLAMGLPEGRALGRVLRRLYDAQLNEELTGRAQALRRARALVREAKQ